MAKRGAYDKKVKVGAFSEMIQKEIDQYCREIEKEIPDIVEKAGKKCAQSINFHAASAGINDRKGYGKSWRFKVTERNGWLGTFGKVYSPKHYRIAHLLEHGHPIIGKNGKPIGSAKAFPHIRLAEQESVLFLENTLKRMIEGKE